MKSNNLLTACFSLIVLFLFSQSIRASVPTDTSFHKRMYLSNLSIQQGIYSVSSGKGSYSDFVKINSGFQLSPSIVDSARHAESMQYNSSAGALASAGFGIVRAKTFGKGKFVPSLRLGLAYINQTVLHAVYTNHEKYRIDTLSSSSGLKIPVDSVWIRNREYQYSSRNLRLDASLIWNSTSNPNISTFFGIGFGAGMGITSSVVLNRYDNQRIDFFYPGGVLSTNTNGSGIPVNTYETRTARPNFGFGLQLPLGLEFRLSNNHKLMKKLWLQADLRPSLFVTQIPELQRIVINPAIYTGWGLKYTL